MKPYRYMADISSNNGQVDIGHYSKAGHAALVIKATEGTRYVNPLHLQQCGMAHRLGLTVIHYHFCRPGMNNPQSEIALFRDTYLKGWRKGDYVVVDLEESEEKNVAQYAREFCGKLFAETGHPPILYTYSAFISEHLTGVSLPGRRWWIAKYSDGMPSAPNRDTLFAWQYSDGQQGPHPHHYAGIGNCDGSILNYGVAIRLWVRKLRTRKVK